MNERHIFEVPKNANEALAILGYKITGIGTSIAVAPIKGEMETYRVANLMIAAFCDALAQIKKKAETGKATVDEQHWLAVFDIYFGDMELVHAVRNLIFFKQLEHE